MPDGCFTSYSYSYSTYLLHYYYNAKLINTKKVPKCSTIVLFSTNNLKLPFSGDYYHPMRIGWQLIGISSIRHNKEEADSGSSKKANRDELSQLLLNMCMCQ
jgi:hypothetical protein